MFDSMNEASATGGMPSGAMSGESSHDDMTRGAVDDMPSGALPMPAMQPGGPGGNVEAHGDMPRGAMMPAGGDEPGDIAGGMSEALSGGVSGEVSYGMPGEVSGGMPGEADAGGAMTDVRTGDPGMGMGAGDMTNGAASGQMPGAGMGMGAAMDPTAVAGLNGPGGKNGGLNSNFAGNGNQVEFLQNSTPNWK